MYQTILRVAGKETEENKKDLWRMILEVYGALRKFYTSHTSVLQSVIIYLYLNGFKLFES